MIGKVPPELLGELVLGRTGADDDRVLQGPAYGEDAAAIALDEGVLVVSSDPLSLAVERLGTLGVHVACNDVAACGASPDWLTNVLFLPDDDPATVDAITEQVDDVARELGVSIVGGHSEYAPSLDTPMLALTAMGLADRFVPTGGATPGDAILLTKRAAVEGTAILGSDFRDLVSGAVPSAVIDRGVEFYGDVSVVPEAAILAEFATAMHDPTEGGLVDGLFEVAAASGTALDVDRDAIPVAEETRRLCEVAGVDPFRIFGSGALIATVPATETQAALAALREGGIQATEIGTVRESDDPRLDLGDETFVEPVRDDMYDLWA